MKDIKESKGALKCKLSKFASIFLVPLIIGSGAGYYFGSKGYTGSEQYIAVGDLTVGDKLTMNEYSNILADYRDLSLGSKDALKDFSKLLLNDRLANSFLGELKFEDTFFYQENKNLLEDKEKSAEYIEELESVIGFGFKDIKKMIVINEKRLEFDRLIMNYVISGYSLQPLLDSITRKFTINEYLVDFDRIDNVTITDEEFDEFYKSNTIKEEDKIHFDKYTVSGIDKDGVKKISDLEKNFKRAVYDYDHKFEDFVLDKSEFLGILGADIELDKGSIFFDDSKIDDGELYVYNVSKIDLGKEVSKEEAKLRIFNSLLINKKMQYVFNLINSAGDKLNIDDYGFLKLSDKNRELDIINNSGDKVLDLLVGLSKGDYYFYDNNKDYKMIEVVNTERLGDISKEHINLIVDYYGKQIAREVIKFQDLITSHNLKSKTYNFDKF